MSVPEDEPGRSLDERLREARERVERLEARLEDEGRAVAEPENGGPTVSAVVSPPDPGAPRHGGHVLFVPSAGGYTLVERVGPPPQPGETVAPIDGEVAYVVTKVARSPLPADGRPCAYLVEA